jgi:hypothetical protein
MLEPNKIAKDGLGSSEGLVSINVGHVPEPFNNFSLQSWQSILKRNESIEYIRDLFVGDLNSRQNFFRELVITNSAFDKVPTLYTKALEILVQLNKIYTQETDAILIRQFDFRRSNFDATNHANGILLNYVQSKLDDATYGNSATLKRTVLEWFVDNDCFGSENLKASMPWIGVLASVATSEDLYFVKDSLISRVRKNYLSGHDHLIEYLFQMKNNHELSNIAQDLLQGLSQGKELIRHINTTEYSLPIAVSALNYGVGALLAYSFGINNFALAFGVMFFSGSLLNAMYVQLNSNSTDITEQSVATKNVMDTINNRLSSIN